MSASGAQIACDSKTYFDDQRGRTLKGYLVTFNTKDEYEFVLAQNSTYFQQQSFWISGFSLANTKYEFKYSSGPENLTLLYNALTQKCPNFCNWTAQEPYFDGAELKIHYDHTKNSWNNNIPSKQFKAICEYGGLEDPFVNPISTKGGEIFISNIEWPLDFSKNYSVILLKSPNFVINMECKNVRIDFIKNTMNCTLPPGTGEWSLEIRESTNKLSTMFRYLSPEIGVLNPKIETGDMTITGSNFAENDLPSIYFKNNLAPCLNVAKLREDVYTCKLANTNGPLQPITITVDGLTSSSSRVPSYYEGRYINLYVDKNTFTETVSFVKQMDYKNVKSNLTYVNTVNMANFLTSIFPEGVSYIVWTSLYYDSSASQTMLWSMYGRDAGKLVTYYTSEAPIISATKKYNFYFNYIFYTLEPSEVTDNTKYAGSLMEMVVPSPRFLNNKTHSVDSQGGLVTIELESPLVDGKFYILYKNIQIPFIVSDLRSTNVTLNVSEGYEGINPLSIMVDSVFGNLTTPSNTQFITYNKANLTSISPTLLPTSGGRITITGTSLYKDLQFLQINFGSLSISPDDFVTPHSRISAVIPPGYGIGSLNINFLNRYLTNNITFGYQPPYILSTTSLKKTGGYITIFGENFFNNESILSVDISGVPCTNITNIEPHKTITCLMEATNYSSVDIIVTIDNKVPSNKFNKIIDGLNPTVSVCSQGRKMKPTWLTITGDSFKSTGLNVTIGGEYCQELMFLNRTNIYCLFAGRVAQIDKYTPLFVNVTVDGLYGGEFVFNYMEELECEVKCVHGYCNIQSGSCQCDEGWSGLDCSVKVDSGGTPTENNGTVIHPSKVNFTSAITHLREIDSQHTVIKTVSMKNIQWYRNNVTGEYLGNFTDESVVVRMNVTLYKNATTINFAGQDIRVAADSSKFVVHLSNWAFQNNLNVLQVIFMTSTDKSVVSGCDTIDTISTTNGDDTFQVVAGDSLLQAKFASYLFIDNRVIRSSRIELHKDDPIVREYTSNNPNRFILSTAILISHFTKDATFDPSFNSLLLSDGVNKQSKDCTKDNKWKVIVIVVCSVVGGVALLVSTVILIKKKIEKEKYERDMSRKLKALKLNND